MQKTKYIYNKIILKIKSCSLKQKIVYGIISLIVIFLIIKIVSPKDNSKNIITEKASIVDLKQTVLATGQVVSKTDLDLSFNSSGVVKSLKINVGDAVKKDQILATLDGGNELGNLTEARGAFLAAQAKYRKAIDGSELALSELALNTAKNDLEKTKEQQDTLVKNAYKTLLSTDLSVSPEDANYVSSELPVISGDYSGGEGNYILNIYHSSGGYAFNVTGLENGSGDVSSSTPVKLGEKGLYIKFPSGFSVSTTETFTISIPNKKSSYYLSNYNAYQSALKNRDVAIASAESLVSQRQTEFDIKKNSSLPLDIDLAKAEVLSAEGQLQIASSNFEHTVVRAPADGTITKIDIKIGELAQALKEAMVLEDVSNLYIESLINESSITYLKIGQKVDITFDAFGKDKIFTGSIMQVSPSSLQSDSVVNYKIKVSIDEMDSSIRPGMNANITISAGSKDGVIAISRAALIKENDKFFVNIITNEKKKKYEKREVVTGFIGDGNMIEIISGLNNNDIIVLSQDK